MAFFKPALSERGIGGRGSGGNSFRIKARSLRSRATCSAISLPLRKTRFQTLLAMSFPPSALARRNLVSGAHPHGVLRHLFINDDNKSAIGRVTPDRGKTGGPA